MSIVNGSLQVAGGNNAWHTTYAAEIPLARQIVLNTQTGQYKIGDGSTALSGLTYYGGQGSGGTWGSITGTLSNQTDLQNALNAKLNASEKSTSADQVVITNGSNVLTSLSLGASQSIRRNAANNAFEAYTPSSGSSVIAKSTVKSAANTGNTNNNIVASLLIPANSFSDGDLIEWMVSSSNNNNHSYTPRCYINTSATLAGATLLATNASGGDFQGMIYAGRIAMIEGSNTKIYPTYVNGGLPRDLSVVGATTNNLTIDWTVDQYFIVAHQLSNALGQTFFEGAYILKR